jgi:hypothetical protein
MASSSLSLMSLKSQSLLPHPLYLFIKCGHLFVAPRGPGFRIGLAQLVERLFHGEFLGHGVRGAPQFLARSWWAHGSVIPARKTVNRSRGFLAFNCGRKNGRKTGFRPFLAAKIAAPKMQEAAVTQGFIEECSARSGNEARSA